MEKEDRKKEIQELSQKEVSTKEEYIAWREELVQLHLRGLVLTLAITIEPDENMADECDDIVFRVHMPDGSEVHLFGETAGPCLDSFLYGVAEEEVIRDHDDILGRNAKKVGLKYG